MSGAESILSIVLMIFIMGIFISFIVFMGILRAQQFAESERRVRAAHLRDGLKRLDELEAAERTANDFPTTKS
ncbi:MAG: hypothetical protein ACI8UO_003556 [Verrucomicrobiales bacterium]|jgi:hypothetical protein